MSEIYEVWRGHSNVFSNGARHKDGGPLMRCVFDAGKDIVTFEIFDGQDAFGNPRWLPASGAASQFVRNIVAEKARDIKEEGDRKRHPSPY